MKKNFSKLPALFACVAIACSTSVIAQVPETKPVPDTTKIPDTTKVPDTTKIPDTTTTKVLNIQSSHRFQVPLLANAIHLSNPQMNVSIREESEKEGNNKMIFETAA